MDLTLDAPGDHLFIHAVNEQGIRVNDTVLSVPFILSSQQLIPKWDVESIADINEHTLQAVFDLNPEVVLIGTGKMQVFLPPETQMLFYRRNIGFEVMTTDAACRTFNVLVSEGRKIVAALLPA